MQIVYAFGLTGLTVIIHALGTLQAIKHFSRAWQRWDEKKRALASEFLIVRVVSILLLLHLLEAGVWAVFFMVTRLLPDLETAFYFSLTSYTTVGYGDVVLPAASRFLGPIEAAVGILMFGWSTAIIVTAVTRIYGSRLRFENDGAGDASK